MTPVLTILSLGNPRRFASRGASGSADLGETPVKKRTLSESKPPELLRRAVKDARAAEKMPGVRLNMGVWAERRNGRCEVCMAGAVMLGLSKADALASQSPYDFEERRGEDGLYEKLDIIDDMRAGDFYQVMQGINGEALIAIGEAAELVSDGYDRDTGRAPWRTYLKAAAILEKAGL